MAINLSFYGPPTLRKPFKNSGRYRIVRYLLDRRNGAETISLRTDPILGFAWDEDYFHPDQVTFPSLTAEEKVGGRQVRGPLETTASDSDRLSAETFLAPVTANLELNPR